MSATTLNAASPPATPTLQRTVTWKSSFVVSLGGCLLVATSLGAIAGDLGPASAFVWTVTVLVGILQCLMIAEMASMFPNKSGGTSVYTHEAFRKWPMVGAIANWGYWCGWVPVIPVNLIIAAGYLKSFIPGLTDNQILIIAIVMAATLYVLNWIGLKPGVWSSAVMAFCAIGPLAVIVLSPVFLPHLFHASNVFPFRPLHGSWHSGASWMRIFKWMFVAMWSSYAMETASTTIAELKDPHRDGPKAITAASIGGLVAYGVLPFMMLAIVGVSVLTQDASVAFLPAAQAIFGHLGGIVVSIMLIAALLLGAQSSIIGSSRAMYQMTHDGQMIKQFGGINRFGVPVGSIVVDASVTFAMLLIFRGNIVNLIAASNVGYLIVFLLLVPAFIILRRTQPDTPRPFKLPDLFVPIAVLITVFNLCLMFIGGPQWDATPVATVHGVNLTVMGVGIAIMLLLFPFYLYRRVVQDRRPQMAMAGGGVLPELKEGQDDLGGRREVIHRETE